MYKLISACLAIAVSACENWRQEARLCFDDRWEQPSCHQEVRCWDRPVCRREVECIERPVCHREVQCIERPHYVCQEEIRCERPRHECHERCERPRCERRDNDWCGHDERVYYFGAAGATGNDLDTKVGDEKKPGDEKIEKKADDKTKLGETHQNKIGETKPVDTKSQQ